MAGRELLKRRKTGGCANGHQGKSAAMAGGAKVGPGPPAWFSRKELREASGWSLTQVRVHLDRLVELE